MNGIVLKLMSIYKNKCCFILEYPNSDGIDFFGYMATTNSLQLCSRWLGHSSNITGLPIRYFNLKKQISVFHNFLLNINR